MSEVLSAEVEEVIYKKKRKLTGIKCDRCDGIIPAAITRISDSYYYRVMTGHHEWGSESCESIEHYDICPRCIKKFTTEYLDNKQYDSAYININRRIVRVVDRWD